MKSLLLGSALAGTAMSPVWVMLAGFAAVGADLLVALVLL